MLTMQTCLTFPLSAAVMDYAEHSLLHAWCVFILVYLKMDFAPSHYFASHYSGKLPDSAKHVIGRDRIWSHLRNTFSDPVRKLHSLSGMILGCLRVFGEVCCEQSGKQTWDSPLQVNIGSTAASKIQ